MPVFYTLIKRHKNLEKPPRWPQLSQFFLIPRKNLTPLAQTTKFFLLHF